MFTHYLSVASAHKSKRKPEDRWFGGAPPGPYSFRTPQLIQNELKKRSRTTFTLTFDPRIPNVHPHPRDPTMFLGFISFCSPKLTFGSNVFLITYGPQPNRRMTLLRANFSPHPGVKGGASVIWEDRHVLASLVPRFPPNVRPTSPYFSPIPTSIISKHA